jgi:hypothetical protein
MHKNNRLGFCVSFLKFFLNSRLIRLVAFFLWLLIEDERLVYNSLAYKGSAKPALSSDGLRHRHLPLAERISRQCESLRRAFPIG